MSAITRETHPERFARLSTPKVTLNLQVRLAAAAGRVVTDGALLCAMYGGNPDGGPEDAEAVLRTIIHKLRRKFPDGAIRRVRGVGYVMAPEAVPRWLRLAVDDAHVVLARSPADARRFAEMRGR